MSVKDDIFPFQFLKKSMFTGSFQGMHYRLIKEDDLLAVYVFPGPYAFDYTAEELKTKKTFPFDEEGYAQAKAYLEDMSISRVWSVE